MTGRDLPKPVREKLRQNTSLAGQGNTNVRLPDIDAQKKRPGFLSMLDDSYLSSQSLPEEDPTMKKSKYKGAYDKIFGPGSQAGSPAGGVRSPPTARNLSGSTGLASSALASSLSSVQSHSPSSATSPPPARSPSSTTSTPMSMSPPTASLRQARGSLASSPQMSGSPSGASPQMVRSPYGSPGGQSTHSTISTGSPQFRSSHGPKSSTPMRGDHNAFSFNVSELSHQSDSPNTAYDASGEPIRNKGYDASGEPIRNKGYDASGEPIRNKGYDASGEPIRNNVTKIEQPIRTSSAFPVQASSEISYVSKPAANQSPVSRDTNQNAPLRSPNQGSASVGVTSLRASGAKAKATEGASGSAPKRNRNSAIMARAAFWDSRVDAGLASDKDASSLEFPEMPSDSFKR